MRRRRFTARVDHDVCVGNATCRAAAPKVFVAVSSRQTVVADPEAERLETGLETAAKSSGRRDSCRGR